MAETLSVLEIKSLPVELTNTFKSVLLVKKVAIKIAKNGSEFLSVELADKTGSFNVICFSDTAAFRFFHDSKDGCVVKVEGVTEYYQNRFSPKVTSVIELSEEQIIEGNLLQNIVDTSNEDPVMLWEELCSGIEKINNTELRETVKVSLSYIEEKFKNTPGGLSMHHAYRHGLMEHTVHILRSGIALLPIYPEVNADLVIAGIILHDIGKTLEYEGDLVSKKSKDGRLFGHIVIGYRYVRKAGIKAKLNPDLLDRLEHIILSHQGQLEWGAAVLPSTPEAVFVSLIDNLDAKMGMVQNALNKTPDEQQFSDFIPGLQVNLLTERLKL